MYGQEVFSLDAVLAHFSTLSVQTHVCGALLCQTRGTVGNHVTLKIITNFALDLPQSPMFQYPIIILRDPYRHHEDELKLLKST